MYWYFCRFPDPVPSLYSRHSFHVQVPSPCLPFLIYVHQNGYCKTEQRPVVGKRSDLACPPSAQDSSSQACLMSSAFSIAAWETPNSCEANPESGRTCQWLLSFPSVLAVWTWRFNFCHFRRSTMEQKWRLIEDCEKQGWYPELTYVAGKPFNISE